MFLLGLLKTIISETVTNRSIPLSKAPKEVRMRARVVFGKMISNQHQHGKTNIENKGKNIPD